MNRTFDARPSLDPRNLPVGPMLAGITKLRPYTWRCNLRLNQFSEGACVGFGCSHELAARPVVVPNITNEFARGVYKEAQQVDEWEGDAYEGTSGNAGAKVLRSRGYIKEWRWTRNVDETLLTVSYKGPVVLISPWLQNMSDTDSKGFIYPSGNLLGWHCTMLNSVKLPKNSEPEFGGLNSWGEGWGKDGHFKLSASALQHLFNQGAEACILLGRKVI